MKHEKGASCFFFISPPITQIKNTVITHQLVSPRGALVDARLVKLHSQVNDGTPLEHAH